MIIMVRSDKSSKEHYDYDIYGERKQDECRECRAPNKYYAIMLALKILFKIYFCYFYFRSSRISHPITVDSDSPNLFYMGGYISLAWKFLFHPLE